MKIGESPEDKHWTFTDVLSHLIMEVANVVG